MSKSTLCLTLMRYLRKLLCNLSIGGHIQYRLRWLKYLIAYSEVHGNLTLGLPFWWHWLLHLTVNHIVIIHSWLKVKSYELHFIDDVSHLISHGSLLLLVGIISFGVELAHKTHYLAVALVLFSTQSEFTLKLLINFLSLIILFLNRLKSLIESVNLCINSIEFRLK